LFNILVYIGLLLLLKMTLTETLFHLNEQISIKKGYLLLFFLVHFFFLKVKKLKKKKKKTATGNWLSYELKELK